MVNMTKDEFKNLRISMGITQATLAKSMGVTVVHISNIESGRQRVTQQTAILLKLLSDQSATSAL